MILGDRVKSKVQGQPLLSPVASAGKALPAVRPVTRSARRCAAMAAMSAALLTGFRVTPSSPRNSALRASSPSIVKRAPGARDSLGTLGPVRPGTNRTGTAAGSRPPPGGGRTGPAPSPSRERAVPRCAPAVGRKRRSCRRGRCPLASTAGRARSRHVTTAPKPACTREKRAVVPRGARRSAHRRPYAVGRRSVRVAR
jgi:hypothetical protein